MTLKDIILSSTPEIGDQIAILSSHSSHCGLFGSLATSLLLRVRLIRHPIDQHFNGIDVVVVLMLDLDDVRQDVDCCLGMNRKRGSSVSRYWHILSSCSFIDCQVGAIEAAYVQYCRRMPQNFPDTIDPTEPALIQVTLKSYYQTQFHWPLLPLNRRPDIDIIVAFNFTELSTTLAQWKDVYT